MLRLLATVLVFLSASGLALADDGGFHRTTPRAVLGGVGPALVIGVPAGRAWGVESALRPLPPADTAVFVRLTVTDDSVREAFVRIAYYASETGRPRQLATSDSAFVATGRPTLVAVPFDPPAGAVAYRVRVLARVAQPAARSTDDAIVARVRGISARPGGTLFSRLLP